jgi:hypothetical protein
VDHEAQDRAEQTVRKYTFRSGGGKAGYTITDFAVDFDLFANTAAVLVPALMAVVVSPFSWGVPGGILHPCGASWNGG